MGAGSAYDDVCASRNEINDAESFCLAASEGQLSVDRGSAAFCLPSQQKPPVLLGLGLRSVDFRESHDVSFFVDISSYLPWILKNKNVLKTTVDFNEEKKAVQRIVGGRDASPGEFPYAVSVWPRSFIHQCDGTLIAPRHVLTTASCVLPVIRKPYRILSFIGDIYIVDGRADDAETIAARRVLIHPDVKKGTDLAIIVLSEPSKAHPINLPTEGECCCINRDV